MIKDEQPGAEPRATAHLSGDGLCTVRVTGEWVLERAPPDAESVLPDGWEGIERLSLQSSDLGAWDSSLILFLVTLCDEAAARGLEVDRAGLTEGVRRLLDLAMRTPDRSPGAGKAARPGLLERVGHRVLSRLDKALGVLSFLGEMLQAFGRLLLGRARFRAADFALFVRQCGAEALPIVTLLSILVGLILAFVGAVQLATFGAQLYIADAVGIGMLRQMGALMTAVLMAGRTGAAFAAQLGSMQVNEEIDAFRTLGIPPMELLVLPRALALLLMLPLLTLYADILGIVGGLLVGVSVFDIPLALYLSQTKEALNVWHLGVGLVMSLVFALVIAVAGCYQGLSSGRSSAAVGEAATRAVVSAIVGIVVADAIITLVTTALGI